MCAPHIGGNAYDHYDDAGILVHKYGPHIFHTNSPRCSTISRSSRRGGPISTACSRSVDGQLVPIPINLDTINQLYGLISTAFELEEFFGRRPSRAKRSAPPKMSSSARSAGSSTRNSSAATRASSGAWIPRSSTPRSRRASRPAPTATIATSPTPTRRCRCTATPGCSSACSITRTSRSCSTPTTARSSALIPYREMIYTGPIDEFFDYRYGKLPYRSLDSSTRRTTPGLPAGAGDQLPERRTPIRG